jgi:hypothetical protein
MPSINCLVSILFDRCSVAQGGEWSGGGMAYPSLHLKQNRHFILGSFPAPDAYVTFRRLFLQMHDPFTFGTGVLMMHVGEFSLALILRPLRFRLRKRFCWFTLPEERFFRTATSRKSLISEYCLYICYVAHGVYLSYTAPVFCCNFRYWLSFGFQPRRFPTIFTPLTKSMCFI